MARWLKSVAIKDGYVGGGGGSSDSGGFGRDEIGGIPDVYSDVGVNGAEVSGGGDDLCKTSGLSELAGGGCDILCGG